MAIIPHNHGDRVRILKCEHSWISPGEVGTIESVIGSGYSVKVDGKKGERTVYVDAANLEAVT